MKKKPFIIGIDVSKSKLDIYIYQLEKHFVVSNDPKGYAQMLEIIITECKCKTKDLFFCFENTGRYSKPLCALFSSDGISFLMSPALDIKKSMGMVRGKNDKIDSKRIANYAYEKYDKLKPTTLPNNNILQIKSLLSLREKLVRQKTACKNGICDLTDCFKDGENQLIIDIQKRLINNLNIEIEIIEKKIKEIINDNDDLKKNFNLVKSVDGIGDIIAFYFIAFTNNFISFSNPRAFACYCGIAPFESSSGTVKGKSHVHNYGNKQLKSLLNLASMSASNRKGELAIYYQNRVSMGENKMSTLNIIRNKLLYRVFAVVKRGTPYVDLYKFAS